MPDLPAGPSLDKVRGPVDIPMFEPWQIALMVAAGICLLALLAWLIVGILRTRKQRTTTASPREIAILELGAAASETDHEAFAVSASNALRRYFEEGLQVPTLGRSTPEFLHSVDLPEAQRTQLDYFLNACDRAKFAREALAEETRIQLLDTAKQLIESCPPRVEKEAHT